MKTLAATAVLALLLAFACPQAQAAGANAGQTGKSGATVNFVSLEPFQVTVFARGRPRGVLVVDIGLEINDPAARRYAQAALPRLRDQILRTLNAMATRSIPMHKPVAVERIANRLQGIADSYTQGIDVLLVNVVLHGR